jgi:predicted acyltransferase
VKPHSPANTFAGSQDTAPQRLLSLDVLRGLTVALMILVNNAGDGRVSYAQLRHSVWNGCTLTDLVFPMFLFIVGASIVLSFRRRLEKGAGRGPILLQVLKRSLLIFAIGLLLNALPSLQIADLRVYGVLQRIAICYALGSVVYLYGGIAASAAVTVLAFVGYWWVMLHVSVPGYGMPGRDIAILDPSANLASWLDRMLVPAAHLYRHTVYDPEGLLSTVPALGTTLCGVLAGAFLETRRPGRQKAATLLAAGVLLVGAGLLWSHWFPLNKRLWTSSYAMFTAGIAASALALLFWCIDVPPRRRWGLTPWLTFGTNALTAYIFSELLAIALAAVTLSNGRNLRQFLYSGLPQSHLSPPLVSLLYSLLFVVVCFLPVLYLYRHRIFLKL